MYSLDESKSTIVAGLEKYVAEAGNEALIEVLFDVIDKWQVAEKLYQPDEMLKNRLREFETWCISQEGEDSGKLMEEIALLSIRCLKGFESVKSYQSYAAQIDLVVSGSTSSWMFLMKMLHLDLQYRSIAIEGKNINKKVDDKQFSRFCYHLQNTFVNTVQLGIFFTRYGATGFREETTGLMVRRRTLRDAQATQILFHAKNNKFIVVLDKDEILCLSKPGMLIRILERKIREIEQWTGLSIGEEPSMPEVDLPDHLSKYFLD